MTRLATILMVITTVTTYFPLLVVNDE